MKRVKTNINSTNIINNQTISQRKAKGDTLKTAKKPQSINIKHINTIALQGENFAKQKVSKLQNKFADGRNKEQGISGQNDFQSASGQGDCISGQKAFKSVRKENTTNQKIMQATARLPTAKNSAKKGKNAKQKGKAIQGAFQQSVTNQNTARQGVAQQNSKLQHTNQQNAVRHNINPIQQDNLQEMHAENATQQNSKKQNSVQQNSEKQNDAKQKTTQLDSKKQNIAQQPRAKQNRNKKQNAQQKSAQQNSAQCDNNKQAEVEKCVIYCPEDKVKQYTEIIKNSDMQPVAVIPKSKSQSEKPKLTFKKVLILLIVGATIGFVNGFLGGGGGMLCVPLLVFVLGLKDKVSHATAILIMLPITIVSLIIYVCNFTIELDTALYVTLGSVAGGIIGSLLLKKLSNTWIRAIFALIMIIAGFKMIF